MAVNVLIFCALINYDILYIVYIHLRQSKHVLYGYDLDTSKTLHFWNCTSNCSSSSRILELSRILLNPCSQIIELNNPATVASSLVFPAPSPYQAGQLTENTLEVDSCSSLSQMCTRLGNDDVAMHLSFSTNLSSMYTKRVSWLPHSKQPLHLACHAQRFHTSHHIWASERRNANAVKHLHLRMH